MKGILVFWPIGLIKRISSLLIQNRNITSIWRNLKLNPHSLSLSHVFPLSLSPFSFENLWTWWVNAWCFVSSSCWLRGVDCLSFIFGKHHFLLVWIQLIALNSMDDLHVVLWDFGVVEMIELYPCHYLS